MTQFNISALDVELSSQHTCARLTELNDQFWARKQTIEDCQAIERAENEGMIVYPAMTSKFRLIKSDLHNIG
jgi:hypothetical protein